MPRRRRCVARLVRVVILAIPHDSTRRRNGPRAYFRGVPSRPKGVASFATQNRMQCHRNPVLDHGAIKRMTKTCPAMLAAKSGVNWSGTHASIAFKMDSVIA